MKKRDDRHKSQVLIWLNHVPAGLFALAQPNQEALRWSRPSSPRRHAEKHGFAPDKILKPIIYSQPCFILMETALIKNLKCCNYTGVHTRPNYPSAIRTLNCAGKISHPKLNPWDNTHHTSDHPLPTSQHISTSWVLSPSSL